MATRKPIHGTKATKAAKATKATAGSGSPRARKSGAASLGAERVASTAAERIASGRIDSIEAGLAGLRQRMSVGATKAAGKARSSPQVERLDAVLKRLGERYRTLFG